MEFCSGKVYVGCGSESLDDTRVTSYPTVSPSEAVNAYDLSARVQPSNLDHSLVNVLGIIERKRRTTLV
jgi:hypothetical protein